MDSWNTAAVAAASHAEDSAFSTLCAGAALMPFPMQGGIEKPVGTSRSLPAWCVRRRGAAPRTVRRGRAALAWSARGRASAVRASGLQLPAESISYPPLPEPPPPFSAAPFAASTPPPLALHASLRARSCPFARPHASPRRGDAPRQGARRPFPPLTRPAPLPTERLKPTRASPPAPSPATPTPPARRPPRGRRVVWPAPAASSSALPFLARRSVSFFFSICAFPVCARDIAFACG